MIPSVSTSTLKPIEGLVGPKDLTVEEYREYFDIKNDTVYRIDKPLALYFRDGGTTHRIVDSYGVVHCVPYGPGQAVILRWKNKSYDDPVNF